MGTLVTYHLAESVASITMDDGKANVLSPAMLAELNAALDRAEADAAVAGPAAPPRPALARAPPAQPRGARPSCSPAALASSPAAST
jgi:hypothetical protein